MNRPQDRADLPVRYVPRKIQQHGAHSGYDQLFVHMGLPTAATPWSMGIADRLPRKLAWRLWSLRPQDTQAAGLRAELGAMPWLATGKGRLCHFIYGEDTFLYTPLWQRGANVSIATLHYPPGRLMTRINPGSMRSLGAIVIVGENQRSFLEQFYPGERIHYCPHAVDSEFFSPEPPERGDAPARTLRLICVGALFRDHEGLADVLRRVRAQGFEVGLDVVGASDAQRALLDGLPDVAFHRGVSDEKLRDLYRGAAVGVLPLTDATANNALLEMMSSGLPVVCSDAGGVRHYVDGGAVRLVPPSDTATMAGEVCSLLGDAALRAHEGLANRRHAVATLGFDAVAPRLRTIYSTYL